MFDAAEIERLNFDWYVIVASEPSDPSAFGLFVIDGGGGGGRRIELSRLKFSKFFCWAGILSEKNGIKKCFKCHIDNRRQVGR